MNNPNTPIIGEIIYTHAQITTAIKQMGCTISADISSPEAIVAVTVLKGAKPLADALLNEINVPLARGTISAQSYTGQSSTNNVTVGKYLGEPFTNKTILLIDDIYDTGLTLHALSNYFISNGASEIKTCVLLNKEVPRKQEIDIHYQGFKTPNKFLIGFGLDYDGKYRDLPYISALPLID